MRKIGKYTFKFNIKKDFDDLKENNSIMRYLLEISGKYSTSDINLKNGLIDSNQNFLGYLFRNKFEDTVVLDTVL